MWDDYRTSVTWRIERSGTHAAMSAAPTEQERDFKRGVGAAALANVVLMAPIGVLFTVTGAFVAHLTDPSQPLPELGAYLLAIVAVLVVMLLTQNLEYDSTYNVVYNESARKRIGLAEKLRQLPLSFFGQRDLSDLTSAVMKDCADHERMFSHVMPQLFGAAISTAVVAVCLVAFDWRLALAALWPIPVAVAVLLSTTRLQQAAGRARNEASLELADGIQEYLECAREIRATNQVPAFLERVGERVDAFEHAKIRAELTAGVSASSAQALLRLGIGTTVLAGALLIADGQVDFLVFFCFLLAVTRVYDPVNVILQTIIELLDLRLNIARLQAIEEEPAQTGTTEFKPAGHDLTFEGVSFSYGGGERVLSDVTFTAREGEVTVSGPVAAVASLRRPSSVRAFLGRRRWAGARGRRGRGGCGTGGALADYAEVFQERCCSTIR